MNLQEIFKKKIIPITFERNMRLFGATTIGVGALMGAGVYVLIGMAAGVAGPSVWISYLACGCLAFFTTLLYAELARILPIPGGYAYAYSVLGSRAGFFTGWFLALGSVFACGLYAIGFAEYFTAILGYKVPPLGIKLIAIGLVAFLTFLNTLGTKGSDSIQTILTWGNMVILTALILLSAPYIEMDNLQPMFPNGYAGTASAISIIYISFFGYQFIANNTDEIVDPNKTVPNAMLLSMIISIVFYVVIAILAILIIPWDKLANSNAPLIDVAQKSIGPLGWIMISVGGVLAAAGALNSTLMSQGRQIYSMGKDRFLPTLLGKIHQRKKTPLAALYAGGLFIMLSLLLFDLNFIAQCANFCLLVSLLPTSLVLRKLYRSDKANQPTRKWKWILPELTLIINIGLLFTLDWTSLIFGSQLGLLGLGIFFFYSKNRAARTKEGMGIVLSDQSKSFLLKGSRILVPMANPTTQQAIFGISNALLQKESGEIVVLSVVLAPNQTDFYEALANADSSLDVMERSAQLAELSKVPIRPVIRAARDLAKGIVHAAEEEKCNLIIMGYGAQSQTNANSSSLMAQVLHHSNTNIIFGKFKNMDQGFAPKRIAVSLGGRVNLELMVSLAGALATAYKGEITFLNILPQNYTTEQRTYTDRTLVEAIKNHTTNALYSVQVLSSDRPQDVLIEQSANFDLLIIGTTKVGFLEKAVVGAFAIQVAEQAQCSVAVVKTITKAKQIIKRI